jgi:C4-type Zn-finger protein
MRMNVNYIIDSIIIVNMVVFEWLLPLCLVSLSIAEYSRTASYSGEVLVKWQVCSTCIS